MSCDHELANEWAHCGGKNASYITISFVIQHPLFNLHTVNEGFICINPSFQGFIQIKSSAYHGGMSNNFSQYCEKRTHQVAFLVLRFSPKSDGTN